MKQHRQTKRLIRKARKAKQKQHEQMLKASKLPSLAQHIYNATIGGAR